MIGMTGRNETFHIAGETDPAHERGDVGDGSDGEQTQFGVVANALRHTGIESFGRHGFNSE